MFPKRLWNSDGKAWFLHGIMIPLLNMEHRPKKQAHHGNLVAFRAGDRLVAAIAESARQSGVSVSEYLRTIAREKVGLS